MLIDRINECLNKYDVVSFDIFDTLINRIVGRPHNVFSVMEKLLCDKYGDSFIGFCEKRIYAEQKANVKSKTEEIKLLDIYEYLGIEHKDEVLNLEKQVEIEFSEPNQEIYDVFNKCKGLKKRIIICSDMYLDKDTIERILNKNGYLGYEKLFLSSEFNQRKASGTLYKTLIKEVKVSANRILHIGDNKKSDYVRAKMAGLGAVHYTPTERYTEDFRYPYTILYGNMPKHFDNNYYWEQIGKYSLGNFLFGYTKWLNEELTKKDFDHIFFLARDGWIMKRALELVADDSLKEKCSYLYVSRRSLIVPSLYLYKGYENRCAIMFWKKHFTIGDFLSNFGLEYESYNMLVDSLVENNKTIYRRSELLTNQELLRVYGELEKEIEANSVKEYKLLISYFRQEGFHGKVAVVDTGWFGNLQNAIEKNINEAGIQADVHGYYIGIREKCRYFDTQKMNGYLYFNQDQTQNQINEIRANAIVEAFHSRDEGSTKCYKAEEDKIIPVLKNRDLNEDRCKIMNVIQGEALKRVTFLRNISVLSNEKWTSAVCFEGFCRISLKPDLKDAWRVGEFVENRKIYGTSYYITRPGRIKKDIHELNWKLGQLKRVLRLKLDYMKIYDFLDR